MVLHAVITDRDGEAAGLDTFSPTKCGLDRTILSATGSMLHLKARAIFVNVRSSH